MALVDKQGPVAVIPSWGGRDGFYGYARHAQGRCDLAWEMDDEAQEAFDRKVVESKGHWAWRALPAWPEIKARGLRHLEARLGPEETSWPIGETPASGGRSPVGTACAQTGSGTVTSG